MLIILKEILKNKKKLTALIGIILILIIAVSGIFYFAAGRYTTRSSYGKLSQYLYVSKNSMSFEYSCPYMSSPDFQIQEGTKVTVAESTKDGKSLAREAKIDSVKYNKTKTKNSKLAWITVTVKMGENFSFNDKSVYNFDIAKESIKELKDKYSIGKINFSVLAEKISSDKFSFTRTSAFNASEKKLEDVKFKFEEKDNKTYLVATIPNEHNFTRLNSSMLATKETGISLLVSPEKHKTLADFFNTDINSGFFYKEGTEIKLSVEVKDNFLIEGQEYTVRFSKGLLTDNDGKTISADYWGKFTYVK